MSQGSALKHGEGVLVVGGDAGVRGGVAGAVDEAELGVDVPAADDDDVAGLAAGDVARMVQVVQPGVWPGVLCAVRVAPPRRDLSPSCSTRSTCAGG